MKYILLTLLLSCSVTQAEWYRVQFVQSYNTIKVTKAESDEAPIVIRIRNLEKVEFIQPDPDKVLLGGKEAAELSKAVLQDQMVWIDNLKAEEGAFVGDVYPAFEQVITAYREHRIVNGDNLSESTKKKLKMIYKQMLVDLDLSPLMLSSNSEAELVAEEGRKKLYNIYLRMLTDIKNNTIVLKSGKDSGNTSTAYAYESEFGRTLFTADAIVWFRNNGQKMHPAAQKLYIDLLQSFQTDVSQNARFTQYRLDTIQKEQNLFMELFLDEKNFERGKFTYTCMDWFKNRGQYMPEDVQDVFINWLRSFQQTTSTDGDFMKERLQWMIDNNGLYFDFLDLGI